MKFWKILNNQIEQTLPDWRDKFLSYKDLKKQLKLIVPKENDSSSSKRRRLDEDGGAEGEVTKEVNDFLRLLEVEIEKFNGFFVEKEEEYVIKWKVYFHFNRLCFSSFFILFLLEYGVPMIMRHDMNTRQTHVNNLRK